MQALQIFLVALFKGHELKRVEAWKAGGIGLGLVFSALSLLAGFAVKSGWLPAEHATPENIAYVSAWIAAAVFFFLSLVQTATSKRVGLPPPKSLAAPDELPDAKVPDTPSIRPANVDAAPKPSGKKSKPGRSNVDEALGNFKSE